MSELITSAGQILGGTICILMTARYVPNAAQAVVNRASMTLGNPVYVVNASQYQVRTPTTITSSGGLVRTFIDALRSNRLASTTTNANTPAMSQTPNFAQSSSSISLTSTSQTSGTDINNTVRAVRGGGFMNEGMITGTGYTPIGTQQASRQVMNPANAPSMENYISASILRNEFSGQTQSPAVTGVSMPASRQPVTRPAGRMTANQIVQNLKQQRILSQAAQAQSGQNKSRSKSRR